jgi:signal transduction histidine kinase
VLAILGCLLAAASLPAAPQEDKGLDHVRVQLKWLHQFQFAGYYAAIEKGFYRDAGLDVELIEGSPGVDPAKVVLSGQAEFGVGTPDLLLSRAAGNPIVVLGAIFQHSPYIFLTLESSRITDVSALGGRRVMIEPQAAELYAYLNREQVPRDSLHILPHTFSTQDLIAGKADVMSAYSTDEPFALRKAGISYLTFTPRAGGVDFYGDCFFTSETQIRDHAGRVRAFYEATLKGWDYAMRHPDEIIGLILAKYHPVKSREALEFEAKEMRELMHTELIPVGYMYEGRWQHIMQTYEDLGMLKEPVPLDGFLYNPNPKTSYAWLYWLTGGTILIALVAWGILLPVWRLNGKLKDEIAERIQTEDLLKAARDAAEQAGRVKMEFLSHISHDLRTPLNSILMQTELMGVRPLDEKLKEEVGVIHEAGAQLLGLVNDLLDMNRIEAGHIDLADVPFQLADVLDPVVDVLVVAARRKGISLTLSVDPSLDSGLRGDPDRLRQILFNLLGNAVKFTDKGSVSIRASRTPAARLHIEVADTGPGIPPESQAAIFEPFTRATSQHTRKHEGTGLGLAIVRRFAEAMGGRVSVTSTLGHGSTFSLDLPLLD